MRKAPRDHTMTVVRDTENRGSQVRPRPGQQQLCPQEVHPGSPGPAGSSRCDRARGGPRPQQPSPHHAVYVTACHVTIKSLCGIHQSRSYIQSYLDVRRCPRHGIKSRRLRAAGREGLRGQSCHRPQGTPAWGRTCWSLLSLLGGPPQATRPQHLRRPEFHLQNSR